MKIVHFSEKKLNIPVDIIDYEINDFFHEVYLKCRNTDLFLINLDYPYGSSLLENSPGIQLLKLLRLYHLNQHCVVYSFYSKDRLISENPTNLILCSQGVTFIQMPYDISAFCFESLVSKKAPDDMSLFFKSEFTLPDKRHYFANWWGLFQLWEVHKLLNPETYAYKTDDEIDDYPKTLIRERSNLNSKIAQYLYGFNIEKAIEGVSSKILDYEEMESNINEAVQYLNELESNLSKLNKDFNLSIYISQLRKANERIEYLNENFSKYLTSEDWTWYYNDIRDKCINLFDRKSEIDVKKEELESIKDLILEYKKNCNNIKEQYKEEYVKFYVEQVKRFLKGDKLSILEINFKQALSSLADKTSNLKIYYIDDQADQGWSDIFKLMIYGKTNTVLFKSYVPSSIESIDEQYKTTIHNEIKVFNPAIILLDLRLKGEAGTISDVNSISGIKLLKLLKKTPKICNIPILITTASNKYNTFKEIEALGAETLWVKEGLDEVKTPAESTSNYFSFIEDIILLSDNKYRTLHLFDELIAVLENKTKFKFFNVKNIQKEIKELHAIIQDTKYIYKGYLKDDIFTASQFKNNKDWVWPSLVLQNLGKVVEFFKNQEVYLRSDRYTNAVKPMVKVRNDASHIKEVDKVKNHSIVIMLNHLIEFCKDFME